MSAETDYPTTDDVQPVTVRNLDSIRADGAYRDLIDDALDAMGGSALADADPDAAREVRDRAATVYDIRSVEEAEALAEAATYTLNGGPADLDPHEERNGLTASQEDAVRRVKSAAEEAAVGLRPEAHGLRAGDGEAEDEVDRGDGLATDGGVTADDRAVQDTERRVRAHLREVAATSQFDGTVEHVSRNPTNGFVSVDVSAGDGDSVCYAPVPREPSNHGLRFRGLQGVGVNGGDLRIWFDDLRD